MRTRHVLPLTAFVRAGPALAQQPHVAPPAERRDEAAAGATDYGAAAFARRASCRLPTAHGTFRLHAFSDAAPIGEARPEHAALTFGDVAGGAPVLARLHSECLTGDAFHSLKCDCGPQLQHALRRIAQEGRGVLLYLRQEGRGIGLVDKVRAYALQDRGADTVDANRRLGLPDDARDYEPAARMLGALGVASVRLLTNNPDKVSALRALGIAVAERLPHDVGRSAHNQAYLQTKAARMGHWLLSGTADPTLPSSNGASS
jgi:GTP cyclohydrolase II